MSRPLGEGEGSQWPSQHSWPGVMLASRLHPGFKGQKEGAGERAAVLLASQMALRKGCNL